MDACFDVKLNRISQSFHKNSTWSIIVDEGKWTKFSSNLYLNFAIDIPLCLSLYILKRICDWKSIARNFSRKKLHKVFPPSNRMWPMPFLIYFKCIILDTGFVSQKNDRHSYFIALEYFLKKYPWQCLFRFESTLSKLGLLANFLASLRTLLRLLLLFGLRDLEETTDWLKLLQEEELGL